MEPTAKRIWVVVVTWNGRRWIEPMLRSVLAGTVTPEVVVVDNHSPDDTASLVRASFPQVRCLALTENLGFGQANNRGIALALEAGADYVLLLNQDLTVQPDAIAGLLTVAEQHPPFGLLSPIQRNYDGTAVGYLFANCLIPATRGLVNDLLLGRVQPVYETPFVPAACWFLRRDALLQAGGFDPLFFMYGEDDDLCTRIKAAGWEVGLIPQATVCHHEHGTLAGVHRQTLMQYSEFIRFLKDPAYSWVWGALRVVRYALARAAGKLVDRQFGATWAVLRALGRTALHLRGILRSRRRCGEERGVYLQGEVAPSRPVAAD